MKRRILVTLLTLALSVSTITGCGSSSDSLVSDAPPATSLYDESYERPTVSNDIEKDNVADTPYVDDYAITEESTNVMDTSAENSSTPDGIMILTLYRVDGRYYTNAFVDAIDPDTGIAQNVFSLQIPITNPGSEYAFVIPEDTPRFGNFQDQFTPDYSKMAITRVEARNRSMHAGWLDKNGNFFDVTAAVGEAETSDFEDPVCYQAIGFTDNGETFVYRKAVDLYNGFVFDTLGYYAMSVNNEQAGSWEMSPSDPYLHSGDEWRWLGEDYRPTDWLDDTHFYADNGRDSRIPCVLIDTEAKTMTEFIPGESRLNWGVVASPDGQQVAFMSRSKSTPANTMELYTMNLANQSTKQITIFHTPNDACMPEMYGEYNGVNVLCTVLDWK